MIIATVRGLKFLLTGPAAGVDRAVARLRALDPALLAEAHEADLLFAGGERNARPGLLARVEAEARVSIRAVD